MQIWPRSSGYLGHCTCAYILTIPGFALAASSFSRNHGFATFVHDRLKWTLVDQSPTTSDTEWLCVDVDGYRIINVYKSPPTRLQASDLSVFPRPVLCAGDLSTNQLRLYCRTSSTDGECLVAWASLNDLALFTTQRTWPPFILAAGTLASTLI